MAGTKKKKKVYISIRDKWCEGATFTDDESNDKAHFKARWSKKDDKPYFYDVFLFEQNDGTFVVRKIWGTESEWWKSSEYATTSRAKAETEFSLARNQRREKKYWKEQNVTARPKLYTDQYRFRPVVGEAPGVREPDPETEDLLKDMNIFIIETFENKRYSAILSYGDEIRCVEKNIDLKKIGEEDGLQNIKNHFSRLVASFIPECVVAGVVPPHQIAKVTIALLRALENVAAELLK